MWFIGVEVEQETSVPTPKKNPGSAPEIPSLYILSSLGGLSSSKATLSRYSIETTL